MAGLTFTWCRLIRKSHYNSYNTDAGTAPFSVALPAFMAYKKNAAIKSHELEYPPRWFLFCTCLLMGISHATATLSLSLQYCKLLVSSSIQDHFRYMKTEAQSHLTQIDLRSNLWSTQIPVDFIFCNSGSLNDVYVTLLLPKVNTKHCLYLSN